MEKSFKRPSIQLQEQHLLLCATQDIQWHCKIISTGSPMFTCLTNRVQHPLVKLLLTAQYDADPHQNWQVLYWHLILFTDENQVPVFVVRNEWPSSTHWICSSSFLSFAAPPWHISSCVKSKNRKYLGNSLYIYFCICQYTDFFYWFFYRLHRTGQKCLRD